MSQIEPRQIYAIGDIQGCYNTLMKLINLISCAHQTSEPFDWYKDQIWLVGDLINRGPRSLETLRWCYRNRSHIKVVLGNHDVHLIFYRRGIHRLHKEDTLSELLQAPDADQLIDWLECQPFCYAKGEFVMCHAGIWPNWSLKDALEISHELQAVFQDLGSWGAIFAHRKNYLKSRWEEARSKEERVVTGLAILTTMRYLTVTGELDKTFKGPPSEAPSNLKPWHTFLPPSAPTVIYGHWAAQGLSLETQALGLDTGCLWGRQLSALRLKDRKIFSMPKAD